MRSTRPTHLFLAFSLIAGAAAGCGGSTEEADPNPGGSVVDSALPDAEAEGGIEAGPEAEPDVNQAETAQPDAGEPDVSEDQSAPETSTPDADYSEASLFDLTMPDVALNDSGATVQTCYDCAASQCSANLAECEQDAVCSTLVMCLFTEGCIDGSGMGGVDTNCALDCAQAAGISGFNDPAVQVAFGVASCVNDMCQAQCALPDGGIAPPTDGG